MSAIRDLHAEWMKDEGYRKEYEALESEFALLNDSIDQPLVKVDSENHRHYLDILDQPPSGEGFDRLMNAPAPWRL